MRTSCAYGAAVALDAFDLDVADGECVALLGGAGAGKTTALRVIAGIEAAAGGRVLIAGRDVTGAPPSERGVAMLFANSRPSGRLTIADHIGLPLPSAAKDEVAAAARAVGLDGLGRRLKSLGLLERQLVTLARAIATRPDVLLADDPTDGLPDADAAELRARIAGLGRTTVYATRQAGDAAAAAARVVRLEGGRVVDTASSASLHDRPPTLDDARSLDRWLNVRLARFDGTAIRYGDLLVPAPASVLAAARSAGLQRVTIGLAPHALRLVPDGAPVLVFAADETSAYVQVGGLSAPDEPLTVTATGAGRLLGRTVGLAVDAVQVFDPTTGTRLG